MPVDKIDQLEIGSTKYDIDLPPDAEVSIKSVNASDSIKVNGTELLKTTDISDWAKASTKPTYTANEVGALPSTTKYAASSSVGGPATSAAKLTNTTKIGDTNQPVYFTANGVPTAISYTISASVPSGAVFTDTQSDWSVTDSTSKAFIKNKPTIPTVNNATLTIQKNGTTVQTFTANASTDVTANITVPTTLDDIEDGATRKLANYLPLSGGSVTGELKLYTTSGDSPRLTFQRGTLTDNYNDWSLYDTAGYLHIQQRGSSSTGWEDRATFTQQGVNFVGTISEGGTSLANKYLGKSAKAADSDKLDGNDSSYYLNYNNLTNTPTLGTQANYSYNSSTGTLTITTL